MKARPPSAEDEFVARLIRPLAGEGSLGLKDDAARIVPPPGRELVVTADAIVLGVHAFPDDPPELIAHKALRVNLSDLAAKGAWPLGYFMTIALPASIEPQWVERFFTALGRDGVAYGCPLLGGDTTKTPGPLSISITLIGSVRPGRMPTRLDARIGDLIAVTGTIGDAALGLIQRLDPARAERWQLTAREHDHLAGRYLEPQPRTAVTDAVGRHARAAMDVSDGLVGDLERLCRASGVAATIDAARVPLSDAARKVLGADDKAIEAILTGGDDYEILLTLPPEAWPPFHDECASKGVATSAIGEIVAGEPGLVSVMRGAEELALERSAYSHL